MSAKIKDDKNKFDNRIIEIDILRGISILLMIFDHFMYDLKSFLPMIFSDYPYKYEFTQKLYEFSKMYWNSSFRLASRYIVVFIFLALTGICCCFSRDNLKRGGKLLGVAYLLTLITYLLGIAFDDIDMTITFGVLHCIAFTILIIGLLLKVIENKYFYLIIGIIITSVGIYFEINGKYESFEGNNLFILSIKQIIGISF